MAEIPVQDPKLDSGDITYQPADPDGDRFYNDGNTILRVTGPSAAFTIAIQNGKECDFGAHPPHRITIPDGSEWGETDRLSKARFNADGDFVSIEYEPNAVGIQVAATRIATIHKTEDTCP